MADSVVPRVGRWLDGNEAELGTTFWKELKVQETSPSPSYDEKYGNDQNEIGLEGIGPQMVDHSTISSA